MAIRKTLGEVLRRAREDAGLSLRDLERLTGMPVGQLSQIESGARKDPGFATILRVVTGIGISMNDVVDILQGVKAKSEVMADMRKRRMHIASAEAAIDQLKEALGHLKS